jgi:hypothetical protein
MFYPTDFCQVANFSDFNSGVLQALLLDLIASGAAAKHRKGNDFVL